MEAPVALNVAPLNAPHKELEWLPLVDRDFQIQDLMGDKNIFKYFVKSKTLT